MNKQARIWLIIAFSLVLVGCIIFVGVMTMLKWDFTKLSTTKYETNHHNINENYRNITIVTNTADIVFAPSEDFKTSVTCHEQSNMKHSVTVNDGTLIIEVVDTRKWYEHIGINFNTPTITVTIPLGEYGELFIKSSTGDVEITNNYQFKSIDISQSTGSVKNYASASETVKIRTSTGNIYVGNIFAGNLDLSASTGNITVSNVICKADIKASVSTGKTSIINATCQDLISRGTTGDLTLKNVIAAEKFSIERDTGDVKFDGCDAAEIHVETDTGDVTGSLLTAKVFITESDTGRVDVPKTVTGGKCEIETDTGDIKITINS